MERLSAGWSASDNWTDKNSLNYFQLTHSPRHWLNKRNSGSVVHTHWQMFWMFLCFHLSDFRCYKKFFKGQTCFGLLVNWSYFNCVNTCVCVFTVDLQSTVHMQWRSVRTTHLSLSSSQFIFHLSASLFVFLLYLLPSPLFFFFFFPWEEKLFYLICTSFLPLSHFLSRSSGSAVTVTLIISQSFVYTTVKLQMFSPQELLCSSKRSALLHLLCLSALCCSIFQIHLCH